MRRRYVYSPEEGRCVEVTPDWTPTPVTGGHKSEAEVFGDLRGPNGEDLSSRGKMRDYLKATGLAHAHDYSKEHYERVRAAHNRERAASIRADLVESYRKVKGY